MRDFLDRLGNLPPDDKFNLGCTAAYLLVVIVTDIGLIATDAPNRALVFTLVNMGVWAAAGRYVDSEAGDWLIKAAVVGSGASFVLWFLWTVLP